MYLSVLASLAQANEDILRSFIPNQLSGNLNLVELVRKSCNDCPPRDLYAQC